MKPTSVQGGIDCLSDELLSKAIHNCHVLDIFLNAFLLLVQGVRMSLYCVLAIECEELFA